MDAYLLEHYDVRRKQRGTQIAAHFGIDRWRVNRRAKELGLSRAKEPLWTAAQEQFLLDHVHKRTAHWIWSHLPPPRRTETAIIVKLKRLVGSRRVTDAGYTVSQLELLLGVDHRVLDRWARQGLLQVEMRGYRTSRDTWCVAPEAVREFIRNHRDLYDLRRVDQPSFLALLLDEEPPRRVETRAQRAKRAA